MPILSNENATPMRRLKGRPARSCSIGTKLTPEEQAKIVAAAEAEGKVPSEWVREKLLECAAARGGSVVVLTQIFTDLVAVQMMFMNVLAPFVTGEQLSREQVDQIFEKIHKVKANKAREILTRRAQAEEKAR
jgi:hypothetical protein